MVVIEACVRLVPGVLGQAASQRATRPTVTVQRRGFSQIFHRVAWRGDQTRCEGVEFGELVGVT